MTFRHTAFLFLLASSLLGYIWVFEHPFKLPQSSTEIDRRVFPELDAPAVSSIALEQGETHVKLEAGEDGWTLSSPFQYPAESTRISAFIEFLSQLSYQSALPLHDTDSEESKDLYGLETPITVIQIQQAEQSLQLIIGSDSPGNITFARRSQSPQIYTLPSDVLERFDADPDSWRDPRVFGYPSSDIRSIHVAGPSSQATITRETPQDDWAMLSPHPGARLDKTFITFLLQQLTELRVDSFHPKLDIPAQITLQLDLTRDRTYALELLATNEKDPSLIWARLPDSGSTIAMPKAFANEMLDPARSFRSPYVFDPGFQFDTIQFEGPESFTIQQDSSTGRWWILHPEKRAADSTLVSQLALQLVELRIADFITEELSDESLFGLNTPFRTITLSLSSAGQNGLPEQDPLRVRFGSNVRSHLMTHRSDETSVFAVPYAALAQIPDQAFKLRDRTLWPQKIETIRSLRVTYDGATLKEWHQRDGEWQISGQALGDIESAAFEALIDELLAAKAAAWTSVGAATQKRYGIGKIASLLIETEQDGEPRTRELRFGSKTARGNRYAATELNQVTTVFEFPRDFFVKLNQVLNLDSVPTE